jgi:signal peptidase II
MVRLRFFSIVLFVVLCDQLTKWLAPILLGKPLVLIPSFLSLAVVNNYGAGFGILQGQRWVLVWISVMVIGLILYYYDYILKEKLLLGAGLVLGGTVGNLIDRLFFGHVVDFISFSFWPAFNLADSAITIGVIIIAVQALKK